MTCKIENDVGITLDKINLKYISTKIDNYKNEIVYYAILNENFKDITKDIPFEMKTPYFEGKDNFMLKIKRKYLSEWQKMSGTATIKMKEYNFEDFKGYFVNGIEIK